MRCRMLVASSTVALLLLLGRSTAPAQAMDDIRLGARIRVQHQAADRRRTVTGTLIGRTADSVRLQLEGSTDTVAIPLDRIRLLRVSRERGSAAGSGAVIGLLSGAVFGFVAGSSCDCGRPGLAGLVLGGIFGGLGSGVGAGVGALTRVDHWQPVRLPTQPTADRTSAGVPLLLVHFTFRGPT